MAGCVGLAALALFLDGHAAAALDNWPIVLGTTVAGGRAIATTVAGATITVSAIVFSITALSTQMAASQYSPRALGGFFEDPFQQTIIGLVVGTFTYSLLILASLSNAIVDGSDPTPSLTVTLALILGVTSAIGIVAYINHSLKRMQIDSVVQRISAGATRAIHRHLGDRDPGEVPQGRPPEGDQIAIRAERGGWIIGIEVDSLLAALPPRSTARVDVRLGEAVSAGDRIVTVWPAPHADWTGARRVRNSVDTARERSLDLDPTFGIRQLVDIALRALSPGVNDPSTAVDVIHHLKTPVREVLLSEAPRRVFAGADERRVFLTETMSRSDFVHAAFSEVRLSAGGQPYVLSALIEVLGDLKSDLDGEDLEGREGAVSTELDLTMETARQSGFPDADLKRIFERAGSGYDDQDSG